MLWVWSICFNLKIEYFIEPNNDLKQKLADYSLKAKSGPPPLL